MNATSEHIMRIKEDNVVDVTIIHCRLRDSKRSRKVFNYSSSPLLGDKPDRQIHAAMLRLN